MVTQARRHNDLNSQARHLFMTWSAPIARKYIQPVRVRLLSPRALDPGPHLSALAPRPTSSSAHGLHRGAAVGTCLAMASERPGIYPRRWRVICDEWAQLPYSDGDMGGQIGFRSGERHLRENCGTHCRGALRWSCDRCVIKVRGLRG
jgi:hypothetical protein